MFRNYVIILILFLLELFIFPKHNFRDSYKILSRTTIHFLGILNSVYQTKEALINYPRFLPLLVMSLNFIFEKFCIMHFYDSNGKYFESKHSMFILFLTIIPFIFLTNKKQIEEFQQGGFYNLNGNIFLILGHLVKINQLFYFYKHFHLKYGNIIEYNFNRRLIIHFIVDFLLNYFIWITNNLICHFLTPPEKRTNKHIMNILKKFCLMILANIAFYSIYSFQMAREWYELTNSNFSQPHNLILYNLLPKDLDQRFRLFLYIFNCIF
jgi:hypothetical protein